MLKNLILGMSVCCIAFFFVQNAYAVTVFPGTQIQNPNMNYTADVSPSFSVSQIITNATDIFLGNPYYDISWVGHKINANITGFSEGDNFTAKITSSGTAGVTMLVLGNVQVVKLDGTNQPFGSTWTYSTCKSVPCTSIFVGSSKTIFLSWGSAIVSTTNFNLSGYVLANNGVFNNPGISLVSPVQANVTSLMLFDTLGNLVSFQNLSTPITLTANVPATIPISLQDNNNPTGTKSYYEQAILSTPSTTSVVSSNQVTLVYGSFTNGNLNFNQTNTNTVPIYFIRKDLNSTDTRLSVIYPNTFNMKCNFGYTFAFTNQTYGPPLSFVPYTTTQSNSSFLFHKATNEIINIICTDTLSNQTGRYVITQQFPFPFQTQIAQFRAGQFGTQGNFGIFDLVTLLVVIVSMIGFNRVNEAVGAFFCISIVGAAALFQIVTLPTFIIGAVIVGGMLAYTSTRKQSGGF